MLICRFVCIVLPSCLYPSVWEKERKKGGLEALLRFLMFWQVERKCFLKINLAMNSHVSHVFHGIFNNDGWLYCCIYAKFLYLFRKTYCTLYIDLGCFVRLDKLENVHKWVNLLFKISFLSNRFCFQHIYSVAWNYVIYDVVQIR